MNKKINDPNIFQLHQEIIKLLAIRLEYAVCDKIEESPTGHKNSKSEILEEIKRYSEVFSILDGTFLEKIFLLIESHSSEAKNKHAPLIGFQGEHGAFSEMATRRYNSKLIPIPCQSFADVFEGVETGTFDLGIVPVENSLGGTVTQVNELLIRTSLKIVGGIRLKISHSLMTLPETDYRDLRVVYSHPQALSQCRGFLGRHKLEGRPYYDTAGAARMLAKDRPAMTAVVAGRLCADLYNLEILKENIQDYCPNYTRFLILSREESKETADKCSIIFSTHLLFKIISEISLPSFPA